MTEPDNKGTEGSARTPSMAASLLVCGVMIGLIMLSVVLLAATLRRGRYR